MTWNNHIAALAVLALLPCLAACADEQPTHIVGERVAQAQGLEAAPLAAPDTVSAAPATGSETLGTTENAPYGAAAAPAMPLTAPTAYVLPTPVPLEPVPSAPEVLPQPMEPVYPTASWPTPYWPTATLFPTPTPFPTLTPPPTATPDALADSGAPVQVEIPAIGVAALIEQVGVTSDGAMDTPRGWMNVAWFSPGIRPGEAGNAVMAGHLDSRSGGPAVFWDLNRLQPGDEVIVTYENGDRYTFAVQGFEVVPYDIQGAAVEAIFGASQTSDLNLITCNGDWDRGKATYTRRLVVYTTLLPEKTVRSGFLGAYD